MFALGGGAALAQTTVAVKSVTIVEKGAGNTVGEGDLLTVRVTLDKRVPRADAGTTPPASVTTTISVTQQDTAGTAPDATASPMGQLEAGDIVIPTATLTISEQADSGTMNILVGRDLDAVNEKFTLTAVTSAVTGTVGGSALAHDATTTKSFNGTIVDAQEQNYEFRVSTPANQIKEGSTVTLTLRADPERPTNEAVVMFLQLSDAKNFSIADDDNDTATPSNQRTLGSGADASTTIEVVAGGNDKNRTDDMLTIDGFTGTVGRSETKSSVSFTVLDIHKLPEAEEHRGRGEGQQEVCRRHDGHLRGRGRHGLRVG